MALGVSIKTIQRYRTQKLISPVIILSNGHARWRLSEVEAALRQDRERTDP